MPTLKTKTILIFTYGLRRLIIIDYFIRLPPIQAFHDFISSKSVDLKKLETLTTVRQNNKDLFGRNYIIEVKNISMLFLDLLAGKKGGYKYEAYFDLFWVHGNLFVLRSQIHLNYFIQ